MTEKVKQLIAQDRSVASDILAWELSRGLSAQVSYFQDEETGKYYRPKPGCVFYEDEPGRDVLDSFHEVTVDEGDVSQNDTYKKHLADLSRMLEPDYDWDAHWNQGGAHSVDDLFRLVIKPSPGDWAGQWIGCGSFKLPHLEAPAMLYRLLWLVEPTHVNFSDMYKSDLFSFSSPDGRYMCQVYLFKYEPSVYFYAKPEAIEKFVEVDESGWVIMCGIPGVDTGATPDETGRMFFDTVKKVVSMKHMVYGGNDFEV